MFGLLRRPARPARSPRRRPRAPTHRTLGGELLEPRLCLSAVSISMFSAMPTNNGTQVTLQGMVMDERPATVVVNFSGVAGGSVSPNAMGQFSLTVQASGLGQVSAVAVDDESLSSGTSYAQVTSGVPTVSMLSAIETGNGRWVTVSGTVTDEVASGRTVTFGGVVSGNATTASNGTFSVSLLASQLGTVTATTTDPWGQTSAVKQATLTSGTPSLSINVSEATGGQVTVSGTVSDVTNAGLTITLGGVASGTTTTDANGQFSVTVTATALGTVTATTQDVWGQSSNVAQANFTSAAPVVATFTAVHLYDNRWEFSGTVQDVWPAGTTVEFGGVISGSTTVLSNGTFTFYCDVTPGTNGNAEAVATDWWGLESAVKTVLVNFV